MKIRCAMFLSGLLGSLLMNFNVAYAQAPAAAPAPAAPAREYSGNFGGGLSLTGGNTDTRSYNLSFSHIHERKNGNTDKITASYLYGSENDVTSVNRGNVAFRDEYKLSSRSFVFGEARYVFDPFKDIQWYLAPYGGLGYKLIDNDKTKLQASGGVGGVWEKNSYVDVHNSGSVNAGEEFSQKIGASSELKETVVAVWKMDDFSDSLTGFSMSLTTSISKLFQLQVEFRDNYKNKPSKPEIKKNDTTFVVNFLLKY
jgi:putative salt-induced outer membrane protein YdiY